MQHNSDAHSVGGNDGFPVETSPTTSQQLAKGGVAGYEYVVELPGSVAIVAPPQRISMSV